MTLSLAGLCLWFVLAIVVSNSEIWQPLPMILGLGAFALSMFLPSHRRAVASLVGSVLFLGGVSLQLQTELNKPMWLSVLVEEQTRAEVTLEILNKPKQLLGGFGGDSRYGVSVRLREVNGEEASGRGFFIYEKAQLSRGDLVAVSGAFAEPGNSSRDSFLFKQRDEIRVLEAASGSIGFFNQLRSDFVNRLEGITEDSKILVSGLAIGEIGNLSQKLQDQMRTTSLTHLVAVSGSNCAIVVGLVYLLAVRLRFSRVGRTAVSLVALVLYVLLVGPDPSVLRAAVMTACVIGVVAMGRRAWAINSLALAAIVLLVADPWLAVEFGFGLSVLATAGILLLAPAIAQKLSTNMPKLLALALSVTISAQLLCLPLLMQLQPGLPTYSIIANLLAGPMVAPVTVLGIIGVILTPILPWLVGPLGFLASLGTFWIESVARFFADLPVAYFPWLTGSLAALVGVLLIVALSLWLRSPRTELRQIGLAAVAVVSVATLSVPAAAEVLPGGWPAPDWNLVACDVGQGDAFLIRSQGVVAMVDTGPDPELVDKCLNELGVKHLDLLVLTHFDFDHVGGLSGALGGRTVTTSIVSGFEDERPATARSLQLLRSNSSRVLIAEPGVGGDLGEFRWVVLAPTKNASEASDSNDASVVLFLESRQAEILLLGDLGEAGQLRLVPLIAERLESSEKPLILKVSHHGSNDQSEEFHKRIDPEISLISVGAQNGYGHPGASILAMLESTGSEILRTDLIGSIAISIETDSKGQPSIRFLGSGG